MKLTKPHKVNLPQPQEYIDEGHILYTNDIQYLFLLRGDEVMKEMQSWYAGAVTGQ